MLKKLRRLLYVWVITTNNVLSQRGEGNWTCLLTVRNVYHFHQKPKLNLQMRPPDKKASYWDENENVCAHVCGYKWSSDDGETRVLHSHSVWHEEVYWWALWIMHCSLLNRNVLFILISIIISAFCSLKQKINRLLKCKSNLLCHYVII